MSFNRVQLVNLASPTPPSNPILGECWVDLSALPAFPLKLWNGTEWILCTLSGTGFGFPELADTPEDYDGFSGYYVRVNDTEDGVEFSEPTFQELTDTPANYTGQAANFVRVNPTETGLEFVDGTGLPVLWSNIIFSNSSLLDIEDTPSTYTGKGNQVLYVKNTEDGIEFRPAPSQGISNFVSLTDTPSSYATQANNLVRVNPTNSALEFVSPKTVNQTALPVGAVTWYAADIGNANTVVTANGQVWFNPRGGSIGRVGSPNTTVTRNDWFDFYSLMWTQQYTAIVGGGAKGISAQADWDSFRGLQMPDLRGRMPLHNNPGFPQYSFGASGGAAVVTLTEAQMPSHAHGVNDPSHAHSISDPGHSHGLISGMVVGDTLNGQFSIAGGTPIAGVGPIGNRTTLSSNTGVSVFGAFTGISVASAGSNQPHENMPPFFVMTMLFYTGAVNV